MNRPPCYSNQQWTSGWIRAIGAVACLLGSQLSTIALAQDTLAYSFEDDLEFGPNGGGIAVTQDTIGATEGTKSMKVDIVNGAFFVGAQSTVLHPAIGDPPGLDHVTFDLTVTEQYQGAFAVVGVMIFGVTQEGQGRQIQTGPSTDPLLEFHIEDLVPGTYPNITIDMTRFFHPDLFTPGSFNDIVGTLGSGDFDMIPTSFQLYFNKSTEAPLTVYIDNIRVGMTPEAIDGDYNGSGIVDAADYTVWRNNLGLMGGATPAQGDGTGDGNVLADDYIFWKNHFGMGGGLGALAAGAVPEPSAALLVLASCGFGLIGRRTRTVR